MPENWSIGKDFVEEHKKIFLRRILDHILMDRLNYILLEAFEQDFEAEEGMILNVGRDLRQRRELSGPSQDRAISRSADGDNKCVVCVTLYLVGIIHVPFPRIIFVPVPTLGIDLIAGSSGVFLAFKLFSKDLCDCKTSPSCQCSSYICK